MTSYRFRVKASWNPRGLYRDIVVGSDRTLEDLQRTINTSFGLDFDHLWFFGMGQDYWRSRVKYLCPWEFENPDQMGEWFEFFSGRRFEERHNAAEVALGDLNLSVGDRLCYLFDYGDEWRFYMILEEERDGDPSDKAPIIGRKKGDDVVQYPLDEYDRARAR
jgi:hypothetical protein